MSHRARKVSGRLYRAACALRDCAAVLALAVAGASSTAGAQPGRVTLSVKPVLCITDRREESCDITLLIVWRSDTPGRYCLHSDLAADAVRCWSGASSGMIAEDVAVQETFNYWLTDGASDARLAEATFDVMSTESDDRRRNRRRRHVWDIL